MLNTAQKAAFANLFNFMPELGKQAGLDDPQLGELLGTLSGAPALSGALVGAGATVATNRAPVRQPGLAFLDVQVAIKGAVAANSFGVTCQVRDAQGNAIRGIRDVRVCTRAVTEDGGDIAVHAVTPLGTLFRAATNPATGENSAFFSTDAEGRLNFQVTNAVAEATMLVISVEGCAERVISLT